MRKFPLDKTTWYSRRDNRTKAVQGLSGFEEFKVGMIIPEIITDSSTHQLMARVAANMLGRWCRNLVIEISKKTSSVLNGSRGEDFQSVLQSELHSIDPYLNLEFSKIDDSADAVLVIGSAVPFPNPQKSIWIDSDGWRAGIGTEARSSQTRAVQDANFLGACFAASLGCAELFRRAIGRDRMRESEIWYSLYDFTKSQDVSRTGNAPFPSELEFGHIHQVGAGAVGSSLDYLLSFSDWKGSIDLIDYDSVDFTNCNRSLPFTAWDAADGIKKIDVCKRILSKNANISARIFDMDYSKFIDEGNFFQPVPDLILCLANDKGIWSTIQQNYPPMVFHATTTPNWGVNFGRHLPIKEWCILCRFGEESKKAYRFIPPCSSGTIVEQKEERERVEGVLPFLSTISAILVLTELAKGHLASYPTNKSFVEFSTISSNGIFVQSQPRIEENCLCTTQNPEIYVESIRKSKYWPSFT